MIGGEPGLGSEVSVPRALGSRYRLESRLGAGAMGEVWLALDVASGTRVAAKLLRPEFARDTTIVARFLQERAILLDLDHPHIVAVRDLVVEGEELALVMDLVDGSDLRRRLAAESRLAPAEAARIVADVLDALAYAHGRGVLHRDVKPDNILLTRDSPAGVRLSDFGIARLAQESTVRATGVLGTAEYIAPEIFTDEVVSPAADVYGAGIVLYELLAGRTPFAGSGNAYAIARRHVEVAPAPLPGLPPPLAALLAALLEKDPRQRPTAAAAVTRLRDLLPQLRGLAVLPPPPDAPPMQATGGATPTGGLPLAVHGAGPPVDPQATALRGIPREAGPAEPRPVAGSGVGLDALFDGGAEQGATQLRPGAGRGRAAPVDVPVVEAYQPPPRPWWRSPLALGALAVVLVAVVLGGLIVVLGHGSSSGRSKSGTGTDDIAVSGSVEQDASGLALVRQASYDPARQQVSVTLSYSGGSAPLSGPFFESVPAVVDGTPCPDVTWDKVGATRDTTVGIDPDSCGWEVDLASVSSGGTDASYSMPFQAPKGVDVRQALSDYLAKEAKSTSDALEHLTASPAYPVQRLDQISVEVSGAVLVGSHITVRVAPIWVGSSTPDYVDTLFDSSTARTGPLIRALGGNLVLSSDDCSSAIGFTANAPYANTQAQRCTITARIGQVSGQSQDFDVSLNTSSG